MASTEYSRWKSKEFHCWPVAAFICFGNNIENKVEKLQ